MKDAEDLCDRVAILINGRLTCIDTVNNLRTKTGGVNISLHRNLANPDQQADCNYLIKIFSDLCPESLERGQPVIIDSTERKIVFFAGNISSTSDKMAKLIGLKSTGNLHDFEITQRSLEDLFLTLARNQQARLL